MNSLKQSRLDEEKRLALEGERLRRERKERGEYRLFSEKSQVTELGY